MLRVDSFTLAAINVLADDIERRLRRTEDKPVDEVSGYKMAFNEQTGKLTLTKGDKIISFTKD